MPASFGWFNRPIFSQIEQRLTAWTPSILRLGAGLLWLSNVGWKVPPSFGASADGCSGGLCRFVMEGAEHGLGAPWRWLSANLILPNLGIFGWFTLITEFILAAILLSGRFTRPIALLGIAHSTFIGLSVANAPGEWYWSYALMALLHLAVFATVRPGQATPALVAGATAGYALIMGIASSRNVAFGTSYVRDWVIFTGGGGFPGDFGRNVFAGSIGLTLVILAAALAAWRLVGTARGRRLGLGLVGVGVILLLLYRDTGNFLGARPAPLAVLTALGLWLHGFQAPAIQPAEANTEEHSATTTTRHFHRLDGR